MQIECSDTADAAADAAADPAVEAHDERDDAAAVARACSECFFSNTEAMDCLHRKKGKFSGLIFCTELLGTVTDFSRFKGSLVKPVRH